jgi:Ca2+:H+ antiporter
MTVGQREANPGRAWQAIIPALSLVFYAALLFAEGSGVVLEPAAGIGLTLPFLLAAVISAVTQAETLAHGIGEPFGTLILTVSVTIIEVALIVPAAFGGKGDPALARDTVFSVVMIVCNGLVALCIIVGCIRHREQDFLVKGASAYLAVLSVLSVLTLILPDYTVTTPGPTLAPGQLLFEAIVTLLLYAVFLFIQTVRHTDYFVQENPAHEDAVELEAGGHGPAWKTSLLLVASLLGAVLLAKTFSSYLKYALAAREAPPALAGFAVAFLVLLPESVTALRAAYANQLQRSINLALGSSLATIGLTVPVVAVISIYLGRELILGLDPESTVLLLLTLLVSTLTFGTGRTNILYGFVHLIVFATYLLLIFMP